MLYVTEVSTKEELIEINNLNRQNLKPNLSKQEQEKQGFVSWPYSVTLLQQMHAIAPGIIVKDDDKVVGYALVTPLAAAGFHADLKKMIENLEAINYQGKLLFL